MVKVVKKQIKVSNDDLPPVEGYLSTGCTLLDLAIADRLPGGFAVGRISHVYGPESSAKSVVSLEPLGSAQRQGGIATLVDSEGTYDADRGRDLFGVDASLLKYISARDTEKELTVEYLFDDLFVTCEKESKESGKPCACTIDSLSAIPSEPELDERLADKTYGVTRAKALSKGFRKHIWTLSKTNLSLIFVDQTRQNVGVTFGKQYTFSGGEALKFYASTRVLLKKSGDIKNKYNKVVGVEVSFVVDKNKIAPPFRDGKFRLLFDYGIDDIASNLMWLKNVYQLKGKYEAFGKSFVGLEKACQYVEENSLELKLQSEVWDMWKEVFQRTERKRKER